MKACIINEITRTGSDFNLPECVGRSVLCVVKLLQAWNCQKLAHRHAVLQQQSNEIDSVVFERLHHRLIECAVWPLLTVNENFRSRYVDAVPRQSQTELLRRAQMLRLEQRRDDCLIQLLDFPFGSVLNSKNCDEIFVFRDLQELVVEAIRLVGAHLESLHDHVDQIIFHRLQQLALLVVLARVLVDERDDVGCTTGAVYDDDRHWRCVSDVLEHRTDRVHASLNHQADDGRARLSDWKRQNFILINKFMRHLTPSTRELSNHIDRISGAYFMEYFKSFKAPHCNFISRVI